MTTWDIEISAAYGVVDSAAMAASEYVGLGERLAGVGEAAQGLLPRSPMTSGALTTLVLASAYPELGSVVSRTNTALTQTAAAVSAYVEGDMAMAAQAQGSLVSIAGVGAGRMRAQVR